MYKLLYIPAILIALFISSCSSDNSSNPKTGMYYSADVLLGAGKAKAFVNLDATGNPESVGLILTEGTLSDLPTAVNEVMLQMPAEASQTNINHVSIDWNPEGHEPPGVYDIPHFDFHFYFVDLNFRMTMTGVGDDTVKMNKMPGQDYMPPQYMLLPGGVPMMGNHAIDVTSPELGDATFTETFIYGFYNANMIFYEPMITIDYLKTKPEMTKNLKVPAKYPKTGYYPTKYSISFNAATKEYTIKLGGMVKYTE